MILNFICSVSLLVCSIAFLFIIINGTAFSLTNKLSTKIIYQIQNFAMRFKMAIIFHVVEFVLIKIK